MIQAKQNLSIVSEGILFFHFSFLIYLFGYNISSEKKGWSKCDQGRLFEIPMRSGKLKPQGSLRQLFSLSGFLGHSGEWSRVLSRVEPASSRHKNKGV
jgi:hypothetical protein